MCRNFFQEHFWTLRSKTQGNDRAQKVTNRIYSENVGRETLPFWQKWDFLAVIGIRRPNALLVGVLLNYS